jgi:CheY-like chemotaxis protein
MDAQGPKILAIDDRRDNIIALQAVLSDALPGYRLLTAPDGATGIAIAKAEDPDAILLDIVMPDMDGFDVCRRLKSDERMKDVPVIFLTALGTEQESQAMALDLGAEGFLSKPWNDLELVARLRAMVKLKEANRMQRLAKERLAPPAIAQVATCTDGCETILIVEDEPAVRDLAKQVLALAGYTVITASNGIDALRVCEKHSDKIHLVLTDVVMPEMGGRVFVKQLAKTRPDIKILYMSGYTDDAIDNHGTLDPGTHLIAKPFSLTDLRLKVRNVLDGRE